MSPLIPSTLTAVRMYNFTMLPYLVSLFLRHHTLLIHQVCLHTNDKRSLLSWIPPPDFFFARSLSASLRYDMLWQHYLHCLAGESVKCPFWNMAHLTEKSVLLSWSSPCLWLGEPRQLFLGHLKESGLPISKVTHHRFTDPPKDLVPLSSAHLQS